MRGRAGLLLVEPMRFLEPHDDPCRPGERPLRAPPHFCSLVIAVLPAAMAAAAPELPLDSIKLPPGFTISVFAANVPNARAMALG